MLDAHRRRLVAAGQPARARGTASPRCPPPRCPPTPRCSTSGDVTLLPGLMDMEVNLAMGGSHHASPLVPVQEDPALKTLRGSGQRPPDAARGVHHGAQPGPLRPDGRPAPRRGPDDGYRPGLGRRPADRPGRPRHQPHRGHLDPTMFQAYAPHVLPLTVEEGIADGVAEVRKAVRYQIKYGARVIKVSASGGCHVPHRPGRGPPVLHRGARGDRRRGPPGRPARWRRTAMATRRSAGHRVRHRLHRARIADERRHARPDGPTAEPSWWPPPTWPTAWTRPTPHPSSRPLAQVGEMRDHKPRVKHRQNKHGADARPRGAFQRGAS